MLVYCVVNDINGKLYIGKTEKTVAWRFQQHVKDALAEKKKRHYISVLHRAIRKRGPNAFSVIVLATAATPEELCKLERHFIRVLKTRTPRGYNLTDGGDGAPGWKATEEILQKFSLASIEMWKTPGYREKNIAAQKARWQDPDKHARQSQIMKKRLQPPEIRVKMRNAAKLRWEEPNHRVNVSSAMKECWQDPKHRAKISSVIKERWQDPEYRARQAAATKRRWEDPEYRAKRSAGRRAGQPVVQGRKC